MHIASTRSSPRPVAVTAFLDGNARMIEPPVMRGYDQFKKSELTETIALHTTGQRRTLSQNLVQGAGFLAAGAAVAAVGTAVGMQFDPGLGVCLGLSALPPALIGARRIQSAFTAPGFQPGPPAPESALQTRLERALQEARRSNPESKQVAYFSGHGSHKEIAHFSPATIGEVLTDNPVDLTVLDACTTAQLEVLAKLGPGAGEVVCSPQPVPSKGFPIEKLFRSPQDLGKHTFEESKNATSHLALVDNTRLHQNLLPKLDTLAGKLRTDLSSGTSEAIHRALKKTRSPDLFGARVDLRGFLENLGRENLNSSCREALDETLTELKETVLESTGWSLSFRVDGKESQALPGAWKDLLNDLGYRWKPILF